MPVQLIELVLRHVHNQANGQAYALFSLNSGFIKALQ
jgi:hypothetical protein